MKSPTANTELKIGLALGSGSARGWSHIGIINTLAEHGIIPDIVCGTSIGALVGASYVSNNINKLQQWACSITKLETARIFEINTSLNGFINTDRLHNFLNQYVASDESLIESIEKQYASVSTDLKTGREVWFTKGSIIEAVWASISLPGLFPAIKHHNQWLVDGGLVNPVPVSVCRALGADIVIAVNLNGGLAGKNFINPKKTSQQDNGFTHKLSELAMEYTGSLFSSSKDKVPPPSLFESIAGSVHIIQDRITRSRMAGDPPDILLSPNVSDIGLLEFYRARDAISEGEKCVQAMLPDIKKILEMA